MDVFLVLLAAGDSKRFGSNKLLANINGKPMYRCILDELEHLEKDVFAGKMLVSQYEEILGYAKLSGYQAVRNNESYLGISHSIHLALQTIPSETAVCFAVCDQPWLTAQTIKGLVDGFLQSGQPMASLKCGEHVGNPAVFAPECREELFALRGDKGGRMLMKRRPEDVYYYEVENERELEDIDVPK